MIENVSDFRKTVQIQIKADGEDSMISMEQVKKEISEFLKDREQVNESMYVISEELACSICLEVVLQACMTTCKHLFCKFCLAMSTLENTRCPLCRTELSESTHRKLLPNIDEIVEIVKSCADPHYDSWARNQIAERQAKYDNRKKNSEHSESLGNFRNILGRLRPSRFDRMLLELQDLSLQLSGLHRMIADV